MSIATLILGEPGTGKSTSLRNLDPAHTLLIQTIRKPLPFRSRDWSEFSRTNTKGNVFVTDQAAEIISLMRKTHRKVIVLDDWNLLMTNAFFRRSTETGFQKFSDIGRDAWDVMTAVSQLPAATRVYLLGHTETDETGHIRARTIGKLISEKCPVESMFSIVLRTVVVNGNYLFSTKNNGQDSCKTPIGLFDDDFIDNDLALIDTKIFEYYGLSEGAAA